VDEVARERRWIGFTDGYGREGFAHDDDVIMALLFDDPRVP
jgi:hypothetical protein